MADFERNHNVQSLCTERYPKPEQEALNSQVEPKIALAPRRAPQAEKNPTGAGKLLSVISERSEEEFACQEIRTCNAQYKRSTYIKLVFGGVVGE